VLDLGVTAEGIERVDIIEELLALGCHRGQGYLISRPVAPEDLRPMLKAGSVPQSLLRPSELTLGLASTTS
jgi:EAL domain-containing protein (putative c-di-GMP-specific phosphodiesterase class I)